MTVSNILKHLDVKFTGINVLEDENLRQGIKEFSDWPTIPQLYIRVILLVDAILLKKCLKRVS